MPIASPAIGWHRDSHGLMRLTNAVSVQFR